MPRGVGKSSIFSWVLSYKLVEFYMSVSFSQGLWAFPRALTYMYGIPTSFVVEPGCAMIISPQSEV
jgi:hypothetical protein